MEKVTKLRSGYAAGLPVCGTAKTQRKRGLLRPRQINRASYTARKALPVYFYARPLTLANPLTSDARSVMLRIPLPEDDGFALTLPEVARATPTADFALLAPKGRQSTDGGERSVTPGHVPLPPPAPSLATRGRGCY